MSTSNLGRLLFAVAALVFGSGAFAQSATRISEFHYDNAGTDVGEAIEISAQAGVDLAGWQVVLYNGANGGAYDARALTGTVPATCGTRGVVVLNFGTNGIQNGPPDGMALVNPAGIPAEFLSYGGSFAATDGPAAGLTSTDVGVVESGSELPGLSLARNAAGVWSGPAANTFGACNDSDNAPPAVVASVTIVPSNGAVAVGETFTFTATAFDAGGNPIPGVRFEWFSRNESVAKINNAGVVSGVSVGVTVIGAIAPNGIQAFAVITVREPPPPPLTDVHFNELHYDNFSVDAGEAIELEGPAGADLTGFSVVLYNGAGGAPYDTILLNSVLPTSCGTRGVFVINLPRDGIQNGSPDGMALVTPSGRVLEFLSYEGTFTATSGPAADLTSTDIGVSETSAPVGRSLQRNSSNVWITGAHSFGACNSDNPAPVENTLVFAGRGASDPPLPVGFEDQLFVTLRDSNNEPVAAEVTWSSDTPEIATVDQLGVVHALAAGTAVIRVTAEDTTTGTYSIQTREPVASTTAQYGHNAEFGEPADADASDDFIVRHDEYTASYNPGRGSPNWVAYDLDATHVGTEDPCNCFTADPGLPAIFPHLSTADYTNAGAFAGYGIDRGHLARSADRTAGSLDNARTYYFDNIVPQAADLNQGPWAALEQDLGELARSQDREVYIIAGAFGNKGTLKNEGKVVIPTHTWKVALILPRDHGLADIHDYTDVEAIAVIMPNDPGVRNNPWQSYQTTIDQVEAQSGYDLFALLADDVEAAVESNTQPPLGAITGPAEAIVEGDSAALSAAGSVDPNGTITSYAWDFGDGSTGSGVSVSHTYVQDGAYTVHLVVTDNDHLTDTETFVVHVSNATPLIDPVPDATVEVDTSYTVSGTFTDPGDDSWSATVNWGDGSAPQTVALAGRSFTLTHTFATPGEFAVEISISDDDSTATDTHTVTVPQATVVVPPSLDAALHAIDRLVARGKLNPCIAHVLKAQIKGAKRLIVEGKTQEAITVLQAVVAEIDFLVRIHVVKARDIALVRALLVQAIEDLGG